MSQPSEGPLWQQGSYGQQWDYLANLTPQQQQRLQFVLNMDDDQVRRLDRVLSKDPLRERLHRTAALAVARVQKATVDTYNRISEAAVALPGQAHRYALAGRDVAVDAARAVGGAAVTAGTAVGGAAVAAGTAVTGAAVSTGRAVGGAAVTAGNAVSSAATATGRAVTGAAVTAGTAVGNAATATGRAVTDAAVTAGTAVNNAATATGRAVTGAAVTAGTAVGSAATATGRAVTGAAVTAGTAVADAAVATGSAIAETSRNVADSVSRWYDRQKTRATIVAEGVKATAVQMKFDPNLRDVTARDAKEAGELYSAYATAPSTQEKIALLTAEAGRLQNRMDAQTAQMALGAQAPASHALPAAGSQPAVQSPDSQGQAQRTGGQQQPNRDTGNKIG